MRRRTRSDSARLHVQLRAAVFGPVKLRREGSSERVSESQNPQRDDRGLSEAGSELNVGRKGGTVRVWAPLGFLRMLPPLPHSAVPVTGNDHSLRNAQGGGTVRLPASPFLLLHRTDEHKGPRLVLSRNRQRSRGEPFPFETENLLKGIALHYIFAYCSL